MADKRTRSNLEDLFASGKIPTESNFADLITSGFNQMEDGLEKAGDTALRIQTPATPDANGTKDAILLFEDFKNDAPQWRLRLRTGGLEMSRGTGTDFIIDSAGKVGIGITIPAERLHVAAGNLRVDGAITSPEGTLRDDNGGWIRTYNATGWYSQTYGGGWYMKDASWIRSYGSKDVYIDKKLRADEGLEVGSNGDNMKIYNDGSIRFNPKSNISVNYGKWKSGWTGHNAILFNFENRSTDKARGFVHFYAPTNYYNNVPALTLAGNYGAGGKVGIGVKDPATPLHVGGAVTIDGLIEQEAFKGVTFASATYKNYGDGYAPVSYYKDKEGRVHIRGLARGSIINTTVFTLPAGYRPKSRLIFKNHNRIDVLSDGRVHCVDFNIHGWTAFDGISFRAEQ